LSIDSGHGDPAPLAESAFTRGRLDALPGISLRPIRADDMAFMRALYASTREDELAPVPWPPEAKQQFLDQQFDFQHRHYHAEFPQAEFLLILDAGEAIGRIYLERTASPWNLIDIALVASRRRHGIGSALISELLAEAREQASAVELHVESFNAARRLYERFGFRMVEQQGVYDLMRWTQPA
jgi:GNAT superfamily N-acetyltransferase